MNEKGKKLVNLPGNDEEADGAGGGGGPGKKALAKAETSGDAVNHRLTNQQQRESRHPVHRRRVRSVNAVSSLIVLIRHHLSLGELNKV